LYIFWLTVVITFTAKIPVCQLLHRLEQYPPYQTAYEHTNILIFTLFNIMLKEAAEAAWFRELTFNQVTLV